MRAFVLVAMLAWASTSARAAEAGPDAVYRANSPLTPLYAVNLQNYFVGAQNRETSTTANTLNLRGVLPIVPHLLRLTVPLVTVPSSSGDSKAGLGDVVLFDAILLTRESRRFEFALGPEVTFPSATDRQLGQGKWQVGAVTVILARLHEFVQLGALVTFQASVAGESSRQSVAQLTAQPILNFQVGDGYYLRSSGQMIFNFRSGQYVVPLGIGAGKVLELKQTLVNLFLEPQFTVLHFGATQPALQIFGGINIQFR